ncbi:MoaF-related domain-containing protein [Nocardia sp. IFM 10818]
MKKIHALGAFAAVAALALTGCSESAAAPEITPYGGHFIAEIDNGVVFDLQFSPDGKQLTYKYLAGGQGDETVDPVIAKVADQTYLITWFEPKTGYTVTHVENYRDGKIDLTWSYPKPDGSHGLELHTAAIKKAE